MMYGVKLVNPRGEVEEVSEGTDPERLRVIRSSYGLLGVIFEVTFRIQPLSPSPLKAARSFSCAIARSVVDACMSIIEGR